MKNYVRILFLITVVSIIAHDLVPHSHYFANVESSICLDISKDSQLATTDVAHKSCSHGNSVLNCLLVYFSVPIHNYIFDFQWMSNFFIPILHWMISFLICLSVILKAKLKATFVYFLKYKSPFVGQINTLRAPPHFSFA